LISGDSDVGTGGGKVSSGDVVGILGTAGGGGGGPG
jgi:hypothetical protein